MVRRLAAVLAVPLLAAGVVPAGAAPTTIIYSFGAGSGDAQNPSGGVVIDQGGTLYGVTLAGGVTGSGAVYSLTPPAAGQAVWTEAVLHSFTADQAHYDGVRPQGRLLLGADGSLFGTTSDGGGANDSKAGTVYQLSPPGQAGGGWTLDTLYVFPTNAINLGAEPTTGVVMDSAGNLYGTTPEQGATKPADVVVGSAYELTPPAGGGGQWTYTQVYAFPKKSGAVTSPVSAPVIDAAGNLYFAVLVGSTSVASRCEIVELSPPAAGETSWTLTVLNKLPSNYGVPVGDITMDASGNLLGATAADGNGTVSAAYRLTPPAAGQTTWAATILATFPANVLPVSGLALASGGQVYGNASGGRGKHAAGVTYQLTPPAGSGRWSYSVLHAFVSKPGKDGRNPVGTPAVGSGGAVFGATQGGGTIGDGTAFQIVP